MSPELFAPFADLAARLWPHIGQGDVAHDAGHLLRVWRNMRAIQAQDGGDLRLLAAAVLLHDCVPVAKDSPQRAQASRLSAARAVVALADLGWSRADCDRVHHAIEAHSFSAGIAPQTLEARIVQDADRLDAIGAIGIARCFAVSGAMGRGLHDLADPAARGRALDDGAFALDHFELKLLRLAEGFGTPSGARMARVRHARCVDFRRAFLAEIEEEGALPPGLAAFPPGYFGSDEG